MPVGFVSEIRRYPVKSLGGESLALATVTERGLPGDRAWAVRDETRGGIRGAKRFPELMTARARYLQEPAPGPSMPAEITFADGRRIGTGDAGAARALSDLVGSPVTLWPLRPADDLAHYRRGAPVLDDREAEMRRIFARTEDEPLPDLRAFPRDLIPYESPPGTYFDAYPILVMTSRSLEFLASRAPAQRFDVRRFRPNFLVHTSADDPFPERAWLGKRLRIGSVLLDVTLDCPRCAMTTHGFEDLPQDARIMRTLVHESGGNLGVYATVREPGVVALEDPVDIVA